MQYFSTRFDFIRIIVLMKIFLSFRIYITPVSTVRPASMDLQIRNKFPYVQLVTRGNNVKKITKKLFPVVFRLLVHKQYGKNESNVVGNLLYWGLVIISNVCHCK